MLLGEVAKHFGIGLSKFQYFLTKNPELAECFEVDPSTRRKNRLLIATLPEVERILDKIRTKKWNKAQLECYQYKMGGGGCQACSVYGVLGEECQMFNSVRQNVRLFGAPTVKELEEKGED
jgi:hypothetical protein